MVETTGSGLTAGAFFVPAQLRPVALHGLSLSCAPVPLRRLDPRPVMLAVLPPGSRSAQLPGHGAMQPCDQRSQARRHRHAPPADLEGHRLSRLRVPIGARCCLSCSQLSLEACRSGLRETVDERRVWILGGHFGSFCGMGRETVDRVSRVSRMQTLAVRRVKADLKQHVTARCRYACSSERLTTG